MNANNSDNKHNYLSDTMDKFWKAALAVGGVAAIGEFVLWSLYKDWLTLPIFSNMTPEQTFQIMKMFLWFVFACFFVSAASYVYVKKDRNYSEFQETSGSEKEIPTLTKNDNQENEQVVSFILQLSPLVFDLIIFGEQEKNRSIKPLVSRLESRYSEISNELRELAVQDIAITKGWKDELIELADSIDKFVNRRVCLYRGLTEDIRDTIEKAKYLKESTVDPFFASRKISLKLRDEFAINIKRLKSLNDRAEAMLDQNRIEELQSNVSIIGHELLKLSMYNTRHFPDPIKDKLHNIAKEVHILETMSINRQEVFRNRLNELCGQLNALAVDMPNVTRET